eukprot:1107828-Pelagomonas_calceolata.AAC.7
MSTVKSATEQADVPSGHQWLIQRPVNHLCAPCVVGNCTDGALCLLPTWTSGCAARACYHLAPAPAVWRQSKPGV